MLSAKWRPCCLGLNLLTHRGWNRMVSTSQMTYSNAFSCVKIVVFWFKFHWFIRKGPINNKLTLVQRMAWRRTGNKPLFDAWASYQIRKVAGCACAGNAENVFLTRRFQSKPLVSDPGMHHGTCVTHVPWCMSGSLTCGGGENVPGIPGACAPVILRIW